VKKNILNLLVSISAGLWIWLMMLWAYIVIDMFWLPATQFEAISVYVPIPQNLAADVAFPTAMIFFILWGWLRKMEATRDGKQI
jgi:hypothetical protein